MIFNSKCYLKSCMLYGIYKANPGVTLGDWEALTSASSNEVRSMNVSSVTFPFHFFVAILHFLGRSVGLDCDCHEIDWCDMVATAVGMYFHSCH